MSLETIQAQLANTEKKRQRLIAKIQIEQKKIVKGLPGLAGFKSIDELFMALARYISPQLRSRLQIKLNVQELTAESLAREHRPVGKAGRSKKQRFNRFL